MAHLREEPPPGVLPAVAVAALGPAHPAVELEGPLGVALPEAAAVGQRAVVRVAKDLTKLSAFSAHEPELPARDRWQLFLRIKRAASNFERQPIGLYADASSHPGRVFHATTPARIGDPKGRSEGIRPGPLIPWKRYGASPRGSVDFTIACRPASSVTR